VDCNVHKHTGVIEGLPEQDCLPIVLNKHWNNWCDEATLALNHMEAKVAEAVGESARVSEKTGEQLTPFV
jgi:hypothetical protein